MMSKQVIRLTSGCFVRYKGKLLLVQETQQGKLSWDIPAGGIEAGETPMQAALREVYEETGLTLSGRIDLVQIFWVQDGSLLTIHFLFDSKLTENPEITKSKTKSIEAIAFQPDSFIKKILSAQTYEHELAKKRFDLYLSNGLTKGTFLTII